MEKDQYISLIKELNGYCDCKDLSKFSSLTKKIKILGDKSSSLLESLSDIHESNSEVNDLYNKTLNDFNDCYEKQGQELISLVENNKLKSFYHNEKNDYKKEQVDTQKALKLLDKNKIITAHCSYCDQQIASF